MGLFKRKTDGEDVKEMLERTKRPHLWASNILLPSTPLRYDQNEPPIDPRDVLGDTDDDLDEDS